MPREAAAQQKGQSMASGENPLRVGRFGISDERPRLFFSFLSSQHILAGPSFSYANNKPGASVYAAEASSSSFMFYYPMGEEKRNNFLLWSIKGIYS
jgi:hypothetical protein